LGNYATDKKKSFGPAIENNTMPVTLVALSKIMAGLLESALRVAVWHGMAWHGRHRRARAVLFESI
jgi:hypothetical protein